MSDFNKVLTDAGIPTTEESITAEFKQTVIDTGSSITNESAYSPNWRFISAVATKPVKWLTDLLIQNVMPQFFLKTVGEGFIDLWGDSYGVERKQAQTLVGHVLFERIDNAAELVIPAGTLISTDPINNIIYDLVTIADAIFKVDETSLSVAVNAVTEGGAYNLEAGYYSNCAIEGVTVSNPENWIDVVGADLEGIEDYRLRIRNAFNTLSHGRCLPLFNC